MKMNASCDDCPVSNLTTDIIGFTNRHSLISAREREIFDIINYVFIISIICLIGFVTNLINIIVFYKQGLQSTMNISFFGLAVSDLCSLVTLLWSAICVNPLVIHSDAPMISLEVQYLTGGAPHTCFVRITGWITVYITAERCLCISLPLRIKQIITPTRTTLIIVSIYVLMVSSFLPEYASSYFDWRFYENKNRTLLGLAFRSNRKSVEGIIFFLYSISGLASFIAVILLTMLLVVQLKRKSKWRMKAHLDTGTTEAISVRDRKTMTMVAVIASVLIGCYSPGVAVSMVTFFEPQFSIFGTYVNEFFVLWSFAFIFEAANSSINMFIYYNMGTKYRETFHQLFGVVSPRLSEGV